MEDSYNLTGHALRKALGVIARQQGWGLAEGTAALAVELTRFVDTLTRPKQFTVELLEFVRGVALHQQVNLSQIDRDRDLLGLLRPEPALASSRHPLGWSPAGGMLLNRYGCRTEPSPKRMTAGGASS